MSNWDILHISRNHHDQDQSVVATHKERLKTWRTFPLDIHSGMLHQPNSRTKTGNEEAIPVHCYLICNLPATGALTAQATAKGMSYSWLYLMIFHLVLGEAALCKDH